MNPDTLFRGMNPRIQIRIRIHTKKLHGSATLVPTLYLGDEVSEKVDGEGENADGLDVLEVDDHLHLAGQDFLVLSEPGSHPCAQHFNAHCVKASVADPDPGSDAFLTPGSGIRDG